MALPLLIGGALLTTLVYHILKDEDDEPSYSSNEGEQREVARIRRIKEDNNNIRAEIQSYKGEQTSSMKAKYDCDISFVHNESTGHETQVQVVHDKNHNRAVSDVKRLKKETIELKTALEELEVIKNET